MAIYYYPPLLLLLLLQSPVLHAVALAHVAHGAHVACHASQRLRVPHVPWRSVVSLALCASVLGRVARVVRLGAQVCRPCHVRRCSCVGHGRALHARVCRPCHAWRRSCVGRGCVPHAWVCRPYCAAVRSGVLAVSCGVHSCVSAVSRTTALACLPHAVVVSVSCEERRKKKRKEKKKEKEERKKEREKKNEKKTHESKKRKTKEKKKRKATYGCCGGASSLH